MLRLASSVSLDWSARCTQGSDCSECPSYGQSHSRLMASDTSADLNVVGFFNVHKRDAKDPLHCGLLDTRSGFQSALAFFYAIDSINSKRISNLQLPGNVKLGGVAVDSCSNHLRVSQDAFSILLGEEVNRVRVLDPTTIAAFLAMGHDNSKATSEIVSHRKITTINLGPPSSLGTAPYYASMSSSMEQQTLAMASTLAYFNMAYVTVVYSDDDEGKQAYNLFLKQVNIVTNTRTSACIGKSYAMSDALEIIKALDKIAGSQIVVLFTNVKDTIALFEAVKSLNKGERFEWFISDRVDVASDIPSTLLEYTRGSLMMTPQEDSQSATMRDFQNYLTSLTVVNHGNIPDDWFEEFWQLVLRCRLDNSSVAQDNFTRPCREDERLTTELISTYPVAGVYHSILAIYMVVQAASVTKDCQTDLAACLSGREDKGEMVSASLRQTRLSNNLQFSFLSDGSGSLGYNIYNLQYERALNSYSYVKVW